MAGFSISVEIAQSKRNVWALFRDLQGYKSWNPFIVDAVGAISANADLDMKVATSNGETHRYRPHVESVIKGDQVVWRTGNLLSWRHTTITFEEPRPGVTEFTIDVELKGPLKSWRNEAAGQFESGFREMANALKSRAEATAARTSGAMQGASAPVR